MIHYSEDFGKRTLCGQDKPALASYNWKVVDCPICKAKGEIGPTNLQVLGSVGLIALTMAPLFWLIFRFAYNH